MLNTVPVIVATPPPRGDGWQKSGLSIFMFQKFYVIMTMFSHNIYKGEGNIGVLVSSVMVMMGLQDDNKLGSLEKT